jgi:DnaJ-class molecular chaperone
MGDMSIPDLRAGDLIVNVFVEKHPTFFSEGSSLICEHELSIWDAVLGKDLEIKTLDSKTLTISVPAGTQPETILSCRNEGLPDMRTKSRGNLLIKFKIAVPKNAGGVFNWALKWIMKGGSINQMVKVFQLALEHQHKTATDVQLLTGQGVDYRFNISSTIVRADNLMCIHQMNGTMVVWSKDLIVSN